MDSNGLAIMKGDDTSPSNDDDGLDACAGEISLYLITVPTVGTCPGWTSRYSTVLRHRSRGTISYSTAEVLMRIS